MEPVEKLFRATALRERAGLVDAEILPRIVSKCLQECHTSEKITYMMPEVSIPTICRHIEKDHCQIHGKPVDVFLGFRYV